MTMPFTDLDPGGDSMGRAMLITDLEFLSCALLNVEAFATALTPFSVRLTFADAVVDNPVLRYPAAYQIRNTNTGEYVTVLDVISPGNPTTYIDLVTTEMREGINNYELTIHQLEYA